MVGYFDMNGALFGVHSESLVCRGSKASVIINVLMHDSPVLIIQENVTRFFAFEVFCQQNTLTVDT